MWVWFEQGNQWDFTFENQILEDYKSYLNDEAQRLEKMAKWESFKTRHQVPHSLLSFSHLLAPQNNTGEGEISSFPLLRPTNVGSGGFVDPVSVSQQGSPYKPNTPIQVPLKDDQQLNLSLVPAELSEPFVLISGPSTSSLTSLPVPVEAASSTSSTKAFQQQQQQQQQPPLSYREIFRKPANKSASALLNVLESSIPADVDPQGLQELTAMGFPRDDAINALKREKGDVSRAAHWLLDKRSNQ